MARLLLVEPDPNLNHNIKRILQKNSYRIDAFLNGDQALQSYNKHHHDLCIINMTLHKSSGLELLTKIRSKSGTVPIIMLTTNSTIEETLLAFANGADHCQHIPFSVPEMIMRIQVFLRRIPPIRRSTFFKIGTLSFDVENRELRDENGKLYRELSPMEARFLMYLCQNTDRGLTREEMLFSVWDKSTYFAGRSMDVYVSRVRKILRDTKNGKIVTLKNIGFRVELVSVQDLSNAMSPPLENEK